MVSLRDCVTKEWLQKTHLFGIKDTRDDGTPFPQELYDVAIGSAIDQVSIDAGITVEPTTVVGERSDVIDNDSLAYFARCVRKTPVVSVQKWAIMFGDRIVVSYPLSWVHIREPAAGLIQLIPGEQGISDVFVAPGWSYDLRAWSGRHYSAAKVRIDYTAGFEAETCADLPAIIKDAVALKASMLFLDTAGDLILGAGIASKSVSQDSRSVSISTTSSAENSGYSARMKSYANRYNGLIASIQGAYRGWDLGVI